MRFGEAAKSAVCGRNGPSDGMTYKVTCKRWLGRLCRLVPRSRNRRLVLIYHAVGSGALALPTHRFREQVSWLAQNARVIAIDELLKCGDAVGLQVALTFDDGYASLFRNVAPILQTEGMVATVYPNTSCLGDIQRVASDESKGHYPSEEFLVWNEVKALRDVGWTIGSHGVDHVDLTSLPVREIHRQVTDSKQAIAKRLGVDCEHFAYTWGRHNEQVRAVVVDAGYRSAVAGTHGAVRCESDRYALPRIDIRRDYTLNDFIAVVRGEWDYLGWVQKARALLR